MNHQTLQYYSLTLMLWALCPVVGGCQSSVPGPEKFEVSGEVTFSGQPVPTGTIIFEPDSAKGNSGPGGGGAIKDGHFVTYAGKGVVGGPYIARISGFTGTPKKEDGEEILEGDPLFAEYRTEVEFPKKNTQHDFEVPTN